SRNLLGYADKCSRLRLDRYTHTEGKCCVERHNYSNDLSKSITIQLERSHAECSRNLFRYPDKYSRLRLDRYTHTESKCSVERYNNSNDLSKSITIQLERSHAECSRNLFRYADKCSRLRLDRYTHTEGKCCVERYNNSNDLSKSITIQLERSHAECSRNLFRYPDKCSRLRQNRNTHSREKCYIERHTNSINLSKSITIQLERSHDECSRNLFRYPDKYRRLRLDRYTHTESKCCVERHNNSNDLSKSIAIQLERPHAECGRNLFRYPDKCSRLR